MSPELLAKCIRDAKHNEIKLNRKVINTSNKFEEEITPRLERIEESIFLIKKYETVYLLKYIAVSWWYTNLF